MTLLVLSKETDNYFTRVNVKPSLIGRRTVSMRSSWLSFLLYSNKTLVSTSFGSSFSMTFPLHNTLSVKIRPPEVILGRIKSKYFVFILRVHYEMHSPKREKQRAKKREGGGEPFGTVSNVKGVLHYYMPCPG